MQNSFKQLALSIPGYGDIQSPPGIPQGGLGTGVPGTGSPAENILQTIIATIFIFIILLVLVTIVWSGINWMFSGGDKSKIEAARLRIIYAIMGLFIVFLSIIIVNFIGYFFGVNFFALWS